MSLNVKKVMNVLLFLSAINACICALKAFTDSHVSLWLFFVLLPALASFGVDFPSSHSLSVSEIHEV
jgi:fucose permease